MNNLNRSYTLTNCTCELYTFRNCVTRFSRVRYSIFCIIVLHLPISPYQRHRHRKDSSCKRSKILWLYFLKLTLRYRLARLDLHESGLLLVRIMVCIESCLPIGWCTFIWWKNPPKCCSILVWIVGCWNKNNWCLSLIFGALFGGKDHGLSTCKTWSKQAGGWIHFWMKRLRTLNSYQILKIKNKKGKTYSCCCPFQELSNGTTLMQIQSGRTVPLTVYFLWQAVFPSRRSPASLSSPWSPLSTSSPT